VVPVSYNDGTPAAVSVIKSIDTVANQFLVESGFIRQVGTHKFKVKAEDTLDATKFAYSNVFTVTVEPDLIANSLVVFDSTSGLIATEITYGLGSGQKITKFETVP
jgi:hypothetical protein